MSCMDEGWKEHVVGPLQNAREYMEWTVPLLKYEDALTIEELRECIGQINDELKKADAYLMGLEG